MHELVRVIAQSAADRSRTLRGSDDYHLQRYAERLRRKVTFDGPTNDLISESIAVVAEAARRTVAVVYNEGDFAAGVAACVGRTVTNVPDTSANVVEAMPAFWFALAGRGVHVVADTEAGAERHAQRLGPLFELLGLGVGTVTEGLSDEDRRSAYAADVTFAAWHELMADHLSDGLKDDPADLTQLGQYSAIISDATAVLFDRLNVPVALASNIDLSAPEAQDAVNLAKALTPGEHFTTSQGYVSFTRAGMMEVMRRIGASVKVPGTGRTLIQVEAALSRRDASAKQVEVFPYVSVSVCGYFGLYQRLAGFATITATAEELTCYHLDSIIPRRDQVRRMIVRLSHRRPISWLADRTRTPSPAEKLRLRLVGWAYESVVETHRRLLYSARREILMTPDPRGIVRAMLGEVIGSWLSDDSWLADPHLNAASLRHRLSGILGGAVDQYVPDLADVFQSPRLPQLIKGWLEVALLSRERDMGTDAMREWARKVLLAVIDDSWVDHLNALDFMRRHALALYSSNELDNYRQDAAQRFAELVVKIRFRTLAGVLGGRADED